jgi:hypothetical protein
MIFHDWRKGGIRLPWELATVLSFGLVLGFYFLPRFLWLSTLADWYLSLA